MLGVYIHVPFCERKCIYCAFSSFCDLKEKDRYLSALKDEIDNFDYKKLEKSENYIELKDGKFSLKKKKKNFVKKNKKHFEGCIDRQVRYSRILSDIPLSQSIVYKEYFGLEEYERVIQNYNC